MIPILDLRAQYHELKDAMLRAAEEVFESGHFINGPNVQAFEREIAEYVGVSHAVGLNSGTDALHLALRALDIGPGDEVITTPFTFVATTEAIGIVGATPVFVDIDPVTYNIDPVAIESAITPRTQVILPVHLYGHPAPMREIMEIAQRRGLAVVEDCAQAIGATIDGKHVGSFGDVGAFSFFPSKNLGAYGDGGMATTAREDLAQRMRALRAHGGRVKYHHEELGVNSRLDELQAAILRVKLPYLERWIGRRRAAAAAYDAALKLAVSVPAQTDGTRHVFHQYTIRVSDRDQTAKAMASRGVQTMVYYPVPLHLQGVHERLNQRPGSFPHSEQAADHVLSLPMFPEISNEEIATVVNAVRESAPSKALV